MILHRLGRYCCKGALPGIMNGQDLIKTTDFQDLLDMVREGAEDERGILTFECFGRQENGTQPGTADVGQLLHVHDHGPVASFNGTAQAALEFSHVGPIDATCDQGAQNIALPLGVEIHSHGNGNGATLDDSSSCVYPFRWCLS